MDTYSGEGGTNYFEFLIGGTTTVLKWSDYLSPETNDLGRQLYAKVREERRVGKTIFPPDTAIFKALNTTPPESVRAVIIGQDPYHGEGQANGLAFSVNPGVPFPPSLKNILREYSEDTRYPIPESGDLSSWASEGVLLLNPILTVEEGKPLSHKGFGWQTFTHAVLEVCAELPQPVVFILWGAHARATMDGIKLGEKKASITSSHPSPLGATKRSDRIPAFLGSRPFTQTNFLLSQMRGTPINWKL